MLLTSNPLPTRARGMPSRAVQFMRGGKTVETSASLPINSGLSKTAFRFPMDGPVVRGCRADAAYGAPLGAAGRVRVRHRAHGRWDEVVSRRWDEVRGLLCVWRGDSGGGGREGCRGEVGCGGRSATLRQPGETLDAYGERVGAYQMQLVATDIKAIAGNYVLIDHGNSEFSLYAHLKPGSMTVKVGDVVTSGQPIAKLGSSGNSTEPHLHFQVCDRAEPLTCAGVPINFTNIELPYADYPRPLQSGDIVIGK